MLPPRGQHFFVRVAEGRVTVWPERGFGAACRREVGDALPYGAGLGLLNVVCVCAGRGGGHLVQGDCIHICSLEIL